MSLRFHAIRLSRSLKHKPGIFTRGPMLKHALVYLNRNAESAQSRLKKGPRADSLRKNWSPGYRNAHRATPQGSWMEWFRWGLILLSILHAGLAVAQSSLTDVVGIPTDAAIYPIPGVGFVNLVNGNLHVEIPLRTITGRNGKKSTTAIVYDNSFWESLPCPNQTCNAPNGWATLAAPFPGGGGYGAPVSIQASGAGQVNALSQTSVCGSADQTTYSNFTYTDPHGTIHPFPAAVIVTASNSECFPSAAQVAAADGSGYWLVVNNGTGWTVYDMHGNVVTNNGPDTNGNTAPSLRQDSLGQGLYLPSDFSVNFETVHVWTNFADPSIAEQQGSAQVISSITLPDGRSYAFQYDDAGNTPQPGHYGTLTGITLPTGGQITIISNPQGYAAFPLPAMVVKSVQTPDGTWSFQYNSSTQTVTATAPPDPLTGLSAQTTGTKPGSTETVKYYSSTATGTPLRTVQTTFVNPGVSSVTTTLEDGKTSSVQYSYEDQCTPRVNLKQEFDFNGNPIRVTKIQYWTTANDDKLLCEQFNGEPTWDTTDPYLGTNNALILHITDIPQSIIVYGPGGVTSAPVAQTNFTYDSTGLTATSGSLSHSVVGLTVNGNKIHDDTDFGTSMKWRGNPTIVSRMTTPGNFITTSTNTYNILGELVLTKDGNGNQTQFDYTDSWNDASCISSPVFAYPTTVTNALNQVSESAYNSCDGSLASTKDQNDITADRSGTVYTYDGLQRVTSIALPDGGNTQRSYGGSSVPEVITTTTTATPNPNQVSTTTLDSLGRAATVVAANGATTQSEYDARGRLSSVTNPSLSSTDSTNGTTKYLYDALGRLTVQTQPDSSTLQWCYEGMAASGQTNCLANKSTNAIAETDAWVDFSDESGTHWQRMSDGLGRLTAVLEPNTSKTPAIETDYAYDALNDLSTVNQVGVSGETAVARSFVYDGMSRLTTAANAESGTTIYSYDGNGNVTSKVDARGSATGGVWYCYDGLNRITVKAYTSQNCSSPTSPAATYSYDSSSVSGNQNPVGRLTNEKVFSGSTLLTQRQPYAYDAMGRLKTEQQCVLGSCSGTPYTLSYTYDAAGNLWTSTNGVTAPQAQLTYGYDAGGRLDLITSSLSSEPNYPPTLFSASASTTTSPCPSSSLPAYDGANQLQYAQIGFSSGTQPVITTTRCYDNRLRPTQETDSGQVATPGVAASTTVTISGAEQSIGASGTPTQAKGTISLSYSGAQVVGARPLYVGNSITLPDGYHASFVATANSAIVVANALAAVLNSVYSPVTAVVSSGGTASAASVVLTTKATGADQNGAITLSLVTTKVTAAQASLSGGAGATYDTGTVTANINGTAVSTAYGQSSTAQSLAAALATAITGAGAGVTAAPGTGGAITVTANQTGTADNGLPVTLSSATDEPKFFSSASFSGTSGTLSGGVNGTYTPATVYSYTIAGSGGASGYAGNGNLVSYTDLMDGGWSLSYDNVNRVSTAAATSGVWNHLTLSWSYDSFGNRKMQTPSGQNVMAPVPQAQTLTYTSQNQISNYGYDGAGNVKYDLINNYLYDPEGRLCAVSYSNGTMTEYMLYLYDGEGRRMAKVSNPTFSCTPASTGSTLQETYLLGPSGEHITELGQAGAFVRSNVYANGQLLATYANSTTYFALNDWLGSKRVVTKYDGTVAQMCMNLPFGDELICSATDLSEQHFTGQIHDQESGNDYFNARYYSNGTGRFMSPDPTGGSLLNPQTLNKYSYGLNNPLINIDPTGLDCIHVNNDTGAYESFDSGDCDNSTPELANSGQYINGTVNQIQLNQQGQVLGYSGTDDSGSSIGGSFMSAGNGAVYGLNPYTGSLSSSEFGQTVTANGNSPTNPDLSSLAISSLIPSGGFSPITDRVGPLPPTRKMTTGEIASLCQMATALSAGGTVPGAVPASPTEDTPDQNMLVPSQNARYPGETRETVTTPMTTRSSVGNNAANGAAMAGTFAECFAAVSAANR